MMGQEREAPTRCQATNDRKKMHASTRRGDGDNFPRGPGHEPTARRVERPQRARCVRKGLVAGHGLAGPWRSLVVLGGA